MAGQIGGNPGPGSQHYARGTKNIGGNMSKLDELKLKLLEYKRSKSISKAVDICEYLYEELIAKQSEVKDEWND